MQIYHIIKVNKIYLNSNVYTHYMSTTTRAFLRDECNKMNILKSLI